MVKVKITGGFQSKIHLERVVVLWPVKTYPTLNATPPSEIRAYYTLWCPLIKPYETLILFFFWGGGWGRLTGHEWFGLEMLAKNVDEESVHLPEFANMT